MSRATITGALLRSAMHFAIASDWAPVTELPLPNGRRADICALTPAGDFVIIEIKSCIADFTADLKWTEYREYCDHFFFAIDPDFPAITLPDDVGILICDADDTAQHRAAPNHRLAPARRQALLRHFGRFAAFRCLGQSESAVLRTARGTTSPQ